MKAACHHRVMGRLLVCCLALACNSLLLHADHNQSSISSLVYNDSVTMGLAENQDDLRSFGAEFSYMHGSGWFGRLEVSGITQRNRASEAGSRYDEMVIAVGTTFHFRFGDAAPRMSLSLRPLAGIVLAGRMGFEGVQNLIHDTFGIERVFLSYERAGISIYPKLGFVQSFDYLEQAPWFSASDLVFRVETDGSFSPGYAHRFHAGVSVGQRTQAISELLVGLGYTWESVEDGWPSHELVGLSESGLTAYVDGHFGMLAFSYTWYLNNLQGYGGLGFDIGFSDETVWKRNDLLLSIGPIIPSGMLASGLRYLVRRDFGIMLLNLFKMIPLADEGRVRENVSSWIVGADYEFSMLDVGFMKPFAALGAGVRRFLVMKDAGPGSNDSNGRVRESEALRFTMGLSMGVRLFTDGRFQYGGVAYGLELSGGIMFTDVQAIDSMYQLSYTERWMPYVRIGLTAGSLL